VYFSESFIVFTSNLGIYRVGAGGKREPNVLASEPFEAVRQKVRAEVDRHFKLELGRPEILNRIGENVIVFDFIREGVAEEIFASMFGGLVDGVRTTQQLDVHVAEAAVSALRSLCLSDLSNGGRGIRNQLEAHFVNPLARALFDAEAGPGARIEIYDVKQGPVTALDWALVEPGHAP
jgi:ATP-dependent Clp protease ATP-binding subunit ClpA